MTTKLRSAGLPIETLPGPPLLPPGLDAAGDRHSAGARWRKAGIIGVREGPSRARSRDASRCCSTRSAARSTRSHGLTRPTTFQWEFTDPDVPTWHLTVNNGSSVVAQGEAPTPDLRLRVAYQDWVDIVGERLDPLRAVATGRLRPRGNPLASRKLAKVFPRG